VEAHIRIGIFPRLLQRVDDSWLAYLDFAQSDCGSSTHSYVGIGQAFEQLRKGGRCGRAAETQAALGFRANLGVGWLKACA
jgi:hypothetical protein